MNSDVLVSICCITYNHAPYIRQCLDGFIMQKTNFKFEILIHDDASTDGTADIIREYEAKYPNILKPIYQTENQYSKGKNISATYNWPRAVGKYVAMCEGDDYWTDPLKLQKQVDFLEGHPDFSMCFHRAKIKNECNANTSYARCEEIETKEYFANDMCPMWIVPTASVVYRRQLVSTYPIKHRDWFDSGDIVLFETCAHVGRVWGMEDAMSVYRMNAGSLLQNPQYLLGQVRKSVTHYRALKMNFPLLDADCMDELTGLSYYRLMKLTPNVFEKLKCLVFSIYYNPSYMWSKIIKLVRRK